MTECNFCGYTINENNNGIDVELSKCIIQIPKSSLFKKDDLVLFKRSNGDWQLGIVNWFPPNGTFKMLSCLKNFHIPSLVEIVFFIDNILYSKQLIYSRRNDKSGILEKYWYQLDDSVFIEKIQELYDANGINSENLKNANLNPEQIMKFKK